MPTWILQRKIMLKSFYDEREDDIKALQLDVKELKKDNKRMQDALDLITKKLLLAKL